MHILSIPGDHCYINSCPDYLRRITIKKNPLHIFITGAMKTTTATKPTHNLQLVKYMDTEDQLCAGVPSLFIRNGFIKFLKVKTELCREEGNLTSLLKSSLRPLASILQG